MLNNPLYYINKEKMEDLTPINIDILTWSSITESSQKKHFLGAKNLHQYIQSIEHIYSTPKNDNSTNIIDQFNKKTYCLPVNQIQDLFNHLNQCRIEGSITHFSEKQISPSGIMIDLDIISTDNQLVLTDKHLYRLTGSLFVLLQKDIKLDNQQQYIFYTLKQKVISLDNNKYKYGFHILIPGIKVDKLYKKWLCQRFKNDPALLSILQELKAVSPEECLDQNSASVPVLFLGSCKLSSQPYLLSYGFEVWPEESDQWVSPPIIKPINLKDLEEYNLVSELSLNTEAVYDNVKKPFIQKRVYQYKDHVAEQLKNWETKETVVLNDDILFTDNSLSTLTMHNPEARYIHGLLDILSEHYSSDRNKWRNVIYALANTSNQYKPLAVWFSQKCVEQWKNNGQQELDKLWEESINTRCNNPITISSISYWAKTCNPEKYASIMDRTYFTILAKYVYEHEGKLQHYMIAKVLHAMLHNKFCVDVDTTSKKYCWFEFVIPDQTMRIGEVWKWRKEVEPDDIHIYISEKLVKVLDQISDHIEEKKEKSNSDAQTIYYKNLGKSFSTSKNSLFNDTFKNGVIKQATYIFRKRGFVEQLDMLPDLFGVGNGVLKLSKKCELIDYYHEYPVSKFSLINWAPFNSNNKWTKIVLDAIADIIVEPDVRNWILFHAAQGLSRDTKEGLLLLFEGGGQNGKTSFLRWVAKALGPYADKFNIQLMSCDREEADKPNSAIMKFKYINWAYAEESNKAQSLNVARMKELVNAGEVSSRDLNSKQETFTIKCNFVVASQYSFIVNTTDHGTWRRLKHYTSKTKFCANPDPANPYEKKDNQDFNLKYSSDPNFLSSMLSILSHYYERLQKEYDGQLKNVPCPTLDIETEIFRTSQDAIHRWICENIVISPNNDTDYDIGTITINYLEWYKIHIDRKAVITSNTFSKEIMSSAISKYLKPAFNKSIVLKGCRILDTKEMIIRDGEEYISLKESLKEKNTKVYSEDWWNC
jgi:phage/plasmid-associated DNA primase